MVSNICAIEEKANEWFLILHMLVMPGQSSFALGRACACHTRITRVSHSTVCLMRNMLYANCTLRLTGTVHISLVPRPFGGGGKGLGTTACLSPLPLGTRLSTYMYVYISPETYSVLYLACFCLRFTCTFVCTCTCAYMHSRSPKTYHGLCIHVHVHVYTVISI